jgi:ABC-type sugar transport system substrate-binding protein
MRAGWQLSLIAVGVTISMLSACSSGSSSGQTTSSSSNASAKAQATAALDGSTKSVQFSGLGPAFKAKNNLQGKTIYYIAVGLSFPFNQQQLKAYNTAAALFGVKVLAEDTGGSTVVASRQIEEAVSRGAVALVLSGVETSAVSAAINDAKAKHVMIIVSGDAETALRDPSIQPVGVYGNATASYTQAGQMMAEIAVAKLGDVHAVFITSSDQSHSKDEYGGFKTELNKLCPTTCSVSATDVPLANWASGVGPATTTAVSNPKINVLAILYDAELPYALPALKAANADGRVSVVTYNATLPGLQALATGKPVIGDPGASETWLGWQIFDQTLRALNGLPPATGTLPNRAFTTSVARTLPLTPAAANTAVWYTDANMKASYSKLWGLG